MKIVEIGITLRQKMKQLFHTFKNSSTLLALALSLLLFLLSCGRKEPALLQKALSYMDENPKEALAILEDASITDFDNEQDSLLYSLLLCQARYKNYLPQTEDSLLSKAFQNFMRENADSRYRLIAHYLKGAFFLDNGVRDSAMYQYLNAQTLAEQVKDKRMQALIHDHLSHLYVSEGLDDKALEESEKVCRIGQQIADTVIYADGVYIKGYVLYRKTKYEEAEKYLLESYNMLRERDVNPRYMIDYITTLCQLYVHTGKPGETMKYAQEGLRYRNAGAQEKFEPLLYMGIAHINLSHNDSGVYYLQKSLESDNIRIRSTAYMCLSDIANYLGETAKANEYERLYSAHRDSLKLMDKRATVLDIEQKYKAEQDEKAKNNEKRHLSWCYVVLILSLFVGAGVLFTLFRRKQNEVVFQLRKKSMARMNVLQNEIQKQGEIVENLEKDFAHLKKNYSIAKHIIQKEYTEDNIIEIVQNIIKNRKEEVSTRLSIDERGWLLIIDEVNARHNNLAQKLVEKGIKDFDLQICCLLLLGFTRNELQYVFYKERTTIYKREKKILSDFFGITDKDKRLKDVLIEMAQDNK